MDKMGSSTETQGSVESRACLPPREPLAPHPHALAAVGANQHQVDVSTQADLVPDLVTSYESEDEIMGRRNKVATDLLQRNKKGTPLYSKEDIREQYCITPKQLDVLERGKGVGGFFGCLSNYHESTCRSRHSLLSVCVRRRVPSDENLHELCRRPAAEYAPLPRWPRYPPHTHPHGPHGHPDAVYYDADHDCSYFRRRPTSFCNAAADPKRYTWMPEDEEDGQRMERPRSIRPDMDSLHEYDGYPIPRRPGSSCLSSRTLSYSSEFIDSQCPAHPDLPPPPPPPALPHEQPRTKHVSFARSHTMASFDEAITGLGLPAGHSGVQGRVMMARSQERLIDGKKPIGEASERRIDGAESPKIVFLEKVKRSAMKTQATQTEVCLGRKPSAPSYLSLSPRTAHRPRVRTVSQGAQTNGDRNGHARRLMKSYSEAGGSFGADSVGYQMDLYDSGSSGDHEALHRTQSEEPPRSPFLMTTPTESLYTANTAATSAETLKTPSLTDTKKKPPTKTYKEIFIDFEPLEPQGFERRGKKRMLQKTVSEGEMLVDRRRNNNTNLYSNLMEVDLLADTREQIPQSTSEENINDQYYMHEEVFMEPLEKRSASLFSSIAGDLAASSALLMEDGNEDEFHENLIYRGLFRKRSMSLEETMSSTASDPDMHALHRQLSQDIDDEDKDATRSIKEETEEELIRHALSKPLFKEERLIKVNVKELPEKVEEEVEPSEVLPPITPLTTRSSPFASSDSLATDQRDHSDGIWNESQATVLQADSDHSCGLLVADLGSSMLALTPSSRRKHLLQLQHQQRSSMDTEDLDTGFDDNQGQQAPPSPRIRIDAPASSRTQTMITKPISHEDATATLKRKPSPGRGILSAAARPRGELRSRRSPMGRPTPEPTIEVTRPIEGTAVASSSTVAASSNAPDLLQLLNRTDSGKADNSETSTEDYVTCTDTNSGTDSSRIVSAGGTTQGSGTTGGNAGDGSSFESASSMYSLARGELSVDDQVQVCSSPPIVEETSSDLPTTSVAESEENAASTTPRVSVDLTHQREGSSFSNASSSSSGSYSVEQSTDVERRTATPPKPAASVERSAKSPKHVSASEDEPSEHHDSSSGSYESPAEDEDESIAENVVVDRKEWTDEEKRSKKKGFKLDFSPIVDPEDEEYSPPSLGGMTIQRVHHKDGDWSRKSSGQSERSRKEDDKSARSDSKATTPLSSGVAGDASEKKDRDTNGKRGAVLARQTPSSTTPPSTQAAAKKIFREKEVLTPGMVRSPAMHEGFRAEDWGTLQRSTPSHTPDEPCLHNVIVATSDESSSGRAPGPEGNGNGAGCQHSPRRHRRTRESPRRKPAANGGRSPTAPPRIRRRSGSGEDKAPVCANARRRSSIPAKSPQGLEVEPKGTRLSPHRYSRSPGSPNRRHKTIRSPKQEDGGKGATSPEGTAQKALSAESLRSVSPGSDSVFYSEVGEHGSSSLIDCHHCHHCGKEVDSKSQSGVEDEPSNGASASASGGPQPDIVQPPAGFADTPEGPRGKGGRLYKKQEKRFRSEERSGGCGHAGHAEKKHHSRYRCEGVRAKSEERGKEDRVKLRPLARSTDNSMEMLRAADSSPSVMHGSSGDLVAEEEDDMGVYAESYRSCTWIYIGDTEEMHVWQKPESKSKECDKGDDPDAERRGSGESTVSEKDFKKKYQAITHRMVHRKSSVEMYKRLQSKSFADVDDMELSLASLRQGLEEVLKQMLMVWCKESVAVKVVSAHPTESDKTVVVCRESGEFGFRIHGSRPVVVSAIEPDTPAETSGLEVGDIVICVNGVNVLEMSHSDVVKLAHAGSDTLELEVASTCKALTPVVRELGAGSPLYSGYLWKLGSGGGGGGSGGGGGGGRNGDKWVRRWFCLKRDNCLYHYKNESEGQPSGALMLVNYTVDRTPESGRLFSFRLGRSGGSGLHLAADTEESAIRWLAVISHSIERNAQSDEWLDISKRNLKLSATSVSQPDCFGHLMKLGRKWKGWKRRYCVLKDACLYFYPEASSDSAIGMACLHGYRVQNSNAGGKRYAFEVIPPEPKLRHFYFHTDSEMEKKRWLAALEYSIDRWIKVG